MKERIGHSFGSLYTSRVTVSFRLSLPEFDCAFSGGAERSFAVVDFMITVSSGEEEITVRIYVYTAVVKVGKKRILPSLARMANNVAQTNTKIPRTDVAACACAFIRHKHARKS